MKPTEPNSSEQKGKGEVSLNRCAIEKPDEPCSIIIVGASGDLTARKLVPALFRLFAQGGLPDSFVIVGCGRTEWSEREFRERMRQAVDSGVTRDPSLWEKFEGRLAYRRLDYDDPSSFRALGEYSRSLDQRHGTKGNRIFYLAIPPLLYASVVDRLGDAALLTVRRGGDGWSRIVVEKPFGRDLESARLLDRTIHRHAGEHQIFRIDHYLAKETVQNILLFRFANAIFEPIWNRKYVDWVSINAAETLGVEHRAGYYERAGVLRDMFQNHMMQLLSLVAMEPPSRFDAERVRDEKAKVFASLRPLPEGRVHERLVLGQYGPGMVLGAPVRGYREEPDVDPGSLTPTFAAMKVFIDNWRWQGVPFLILSGKRLSRKITNIVVQFKEVPHCMFQDLLGERILANRLTFAIHPSEGITLSFQAKSPGPALCLRGVGMRFDYEDGMGPLALDAYEKVLLDCIRGDQMLFWREDGVELCWSFLTPILGECESCDDRTEKLHFYDAGSWGPEDALRMFPDPSVLGA